MFSRLSVSFLVGVVFYSGFAQAQTQNLATQEGEAIELLREINQRIKSSHEEQNEFDVDIFADNFPDTIGAPYPSFFY